MSTQALDAPVNSTYLANNYNSLKELASLVLCYPVEARWLRDNLVQLKEEVSEDYERVGTAYVSICGHLSTNLDKLVRYTDKLDTDAVAIIRRQSYSCWQYYSGHRTFPVPAPLSVPIVIGGYSSEAAAAFCTCKESEMFNLHTPYGALRISLLCSMIESLNSCIDMTSKYKG